MPFLRALNRTINIFRLALGQIGRVGAWWPLLAYAALRAGILWIGANYTSPEIYPVISSYLNWFGGLTAKLGIAPNAAESFSHYPALFYLLPTQFEWLALPSGILFEGLAVGLTVSWLTPYLAPRHPQETLARRLKVANWAKIAITWTLLYALVSVVSFYLANSMAEWLSGSPRRTLMFDSGMFVLTHMLIAPFALAIPLLGINERGKSGLGFAFKQSLRVYARHPLMVTFILLAPPLVFMFPLVMANSPGAGLIYKLRPEFSLYVLSALIVANLVVNLIYAGTFARLALEERHL